MEEAIDRVGIPDPADTQLVSKGSKGKNPNRVEAGRRNRLQRGESSDTVRAQLRAAALLHRPWEHSTGPRTVVGRKQAAINGKKRQIGPLSVREVRSELAAEGLWLEELARVRREVLKGES